MTVWVYVKITEKYRVKMGKLISEMIHTHSYMKSRNTLQNRGFFRCSVPIRTLLAFSLKVEEKIKHETKTRKQMTITIEFPTDFQECGTDENGIIQWDIEEEE